MELNYLAIVIATVVQFIIGAAWYSVLFGKLWGEIHGYNKLSKDVQEEMAKKMGPFYGLQAFLTFITTVVLALLINYTNALNPYALAFLVWIGFILPTQISAAVFGGTEGKWLVKKVAVQTSASLVCLLAAATILNIFK